MTTTVTLLVPRKAAEAAQTTQYTSENGTTVIDKFTVTNTSAAGVTFVANLVEAGGTASSANTVLTRTIAPGQTYLCPELAGQVLRSGDFLSTLAGAGGALTISGNGRLIT